MRGHGRGLVGVAGFLLVVSACSSTGGTGATGAGSDPSPEPESSAGTPAPPSSSGASASGASPSTTSSATTAPGTASSDGSSSASGTPSDTSPSTTSPSTASPTAPPGEAAELPRGGVEIFPEYRLFGYSGNPGSEALGRLGIGDLDERVEEMQERGAEYADGRELLPVLELIATVVHPTPQSDGMYRTRTPDEVVQDHLDAARRHDGLLLLNIQPGQADFIDEVRYWEDFLVEPDVGVALDPEWAMQEGAVPGELYGRTTGAELDEVSAYLDGLVEEHDLPQKVMVYHQVHRSVVQDIDDLTDRDGVVVIQSVDGIGARADKIGTYDRVRQDTPEFVHAGFKLFYEEDAALGPLMTAAEVMGLDPPPEYVLFE